MEHPMTEPWIDFAELRRRARFEPVLAHYGLTLVGKGPQRSVLCPFHDEQNPSCKINLEKKLFHCFGCDAKGNILDFVVRQEQGSIRDGAQRLAELCGIPLAEVMKEPERAEPPRKPERRGRRKPQDAREGPSTGETARPTENARDGPPVAPGQPINPPLTFSLKLDPTHPYLTQTRGLSSETIARFSLGYANRGMMKGRIAIPIHDEHGVLVAYAGRWPGEAGWPEGEDRYKLPQGFEKTRVLFNLHRVADIDHAIVVEGYFSLFRLHELGYDNVVALMGRSLSPWQADMLATRFAKLTLLLDGDGPGRAATVDILPRLTRRLWVRAPELPEGTQPDTVAEDTLRVLLDVAAVR